MKNCGSLVHQEVATKAFMEELRSLVKSSTDESVKKKVLEMIQNWGMAFRNSQKYGIVTVRTSKHHHWHKQGEQQKPHCRFA